MEFLTISEAASLSGKSIQTIRRMIKRKKVQIKRQKTPQGFQYLIDKASLTKPSPSLPQEMIERRHQSLDESLYIHEVSRLNDTIQKLVSQNEKDKENFFGLIKTFQDRVSTLENQIKLLEAPKKRWWQMRVF